MDSVTKNALMVTMVRMVSVWIAIRNAVDAVVQVLLNVRDATICMCWTTLVVCRAVPRVSMSMVEYANHVVLIRLHARV